VSGAKFEILFKILREVAVKHRVLWMLCAATVALIVAQVKLHAQVAELPKPPLKGYYTYKPWKGGTARDAMAASAKATTIPLASFNFTASKDGNSYTDVIVGQSPFDKTPKPTTVKILIVPMIIHIGNAVFDPTAKNTCGGSLGHTDLANFRGSPILTPVTFDGGTGAGHASLINGVNMGKDTYNNAHRRAEFLQAIGGPKSKYSVNYQIKVAPTQTISAATTAGNSEILFDNGGCALLGGLEINFFDNYFTTTVLNAVQANPTEFVIFLMRDTVFYDTTPNNCCFLGYHGTLSNLQTYSPTDYDTTGAFQGVGDITVAAHEIGEWLDDPLGNNPTPLWGNIGQVLGACQNNWEVGDPLSGTNFPPITMPDHVSYTPQETAFWSWFYSADHDPNFQNITAGGKYSMNGTFGGPSVACPPGGTFPN
jgi:hypothetical protein